MAKNRDHDLGRETELIVILVDWRYHITTAPVATATVFCALAVEGEMSVWLVKRVVDVVVAAVVVVVVVAVDAVIGVLWIDTRIIHDFTAHNVGLVKVSRQR